MILGVIALVFAAGGLWVSMVAYRRSGGRWEMRTLQDEIRAELETTSDSLLGSLETRDQPH